MDLIAFLIESVNSPAHVGLLQVFEPVNDSSADVIQRVLKEYRKSTIAPPFNYYPVFPRFGLPKWAEATHFDVAYHIRHAAVPPPGTEQQLRDLVMDLHAGMMDRSRPGWVAYVIEGLENDCFAVYWKVHHAYIDGASGAMLLEESLSDRADDLAVRPLWSPLFKSPVQKRDLTLAELLGEASLSLGEQALALGDIVQSLGRSVKQARGELHRNVPLPFSAPKSLFNQPVHATRSLGVGTSPVRRYKTLAKQEAVSINEVILTIVGAALDRYSQAHGNAPDGQLVAACPMAVRREGDTNASTQISAITVKLGDAGMDICERLRHVHASSRDAKEEAKQMSREALINYLVLIGGAATVLSKTPLADVIPPLTSVNVSNVTGPKNRCFLSGAEMISSYPLSTLAGGSAINITFTSFSGRMEFAVIADALAVPKAQDIADLILEALDELEAAVVSTTARSAKRKPRTKVESKPKKSVDVTQ
jgi:diacylglycerol O-acyltransferase